MYISVDAEWRDVHFQAASRAAVQAQKRQSATPLPLHYIEVILALVQTITHAMVSDDRNYERIHAALLHGLSLSAADLASSAVQLHAVVAGVLSLEAGQTVHRATKTATGDSNPDNIAGKTRLAALAVFHKLSSLQNGIPITLVSLYDFIIVFTSSDSHASANEVSLARRTIASLLRKKPSLVRALENQLLPAWSDTMTSFRPTVQDHWLDEARALFTSISVVSRIATVRDALQASSSSSPFWSAYQTFYDIVLPKLFSSSIHADAQPLSQLSSVKDYAAFRKDLVDYFTSFFPQLSAETLTESLENEASNPELPENLTDLPLTSLINMTLLQDAEYYYGISRQVGLRKPAITSMSQEERSYLQNALDFSKTLPKDNISDSLAIVSKGKGKASTNGHEGQSSASKVRLPHSLGMPMIAAALQSKARSARTVSFKRWPESAFGWRLEMAPFV